MATDGMWTLTDDGEFVLMEPYKSQLLEARLVATVAERSVYDEQFLKDELMRRCHEEGMSAMEIVEEFVLEALGGDL